MPGCSHKSFGQKISAYYHYGMFHSDSGLLPCNFLCKSCPMKFPTLGSLNFHRILHLKKPKGKQIGSSSKDKIFLKFKNTCSIEIALTK